MSEIFPKDILLRCGGRTWLRHGVLAVAGARKGLVEVPVTFSRADASTCATYIDQDGIVRLAAANVPRIEYPPALLGLVDQFGYPYCGPSLEGSRQNILENGSCDADIVGTNGANGGETRVNDATHIRLGANALKVTTQNVGGTGHWYSKRDGSRVPAAASTTYSISCWIYAESDAVGKTMAWTINWWNAVPAVISASTSGATALVAGWQRITFSATSPVGTVTCQPIFQTSGVLGIFNYWADLAQFELGAFASSPIPTNTVAVTRAADSLTLPLNFGPMAMSFLCEFIETGNLLNNGADGTRLFFLGDSATPAIWLQARNNNDYQINHHNGVTQVSKDTATGMVTGDRVQIVGNLFADGSVQIHRALNGGAFSSSTQSSVAALSKNWSSQVLRIAGQGATPGFMTLRDLAFVRGVRSPVEMIAFP